MKDSRGIELVAGQMAVLGHGGSVVIVTVAEVVPDCNRVRVTDGFNSSFFHQPDRLTVVMLPVA